MYRKPKKWIAIAIGLGSPPLAMMYVAHAWLAAAYLAGSIFLGLAYFFLLGTWPWAFNWIALAFAVVGSFHAYHLAKTYDDARGRPWHSRWYGLISVFVLVVMFFLCIRAFLFEPFRAPARSMAPAIESGAHMIVKKWGYGNYGTFGIQLMKTSVSVEIQRGDIMVFKYPVEPAYDVVKRVIGLPGDRITYHNKRLKINDRELPVVSAGEYVFDGRSPRALQFVEQNGDHEYNILLDPDAPADSPFLHAFPYWERCSNSPEGISCHVPDGNYFVMGDNRDNSSDSRLWGFVPIGNFVGKVEYIFQ